MPLITVNFKTVANLKRSIQLPEETTVEQLKKSIGEAFELDEHGMKIVYKGTVVTEGTLKTIGYDPAFTFVVVAKRKNSLTGNAVKRARLENEQRGDAPLDLPGEPEKEEKKPAPSALHALRGRDVEPSSDAAAAAAAEGDDGDDGEGALLDLAELLRMAASGMVPLEIDIDEEGEEDDEDESSGGEEGEGEGEGEGEDEGPAPGHDLTDAEKEVVARLMELGFDEMSATQAYLAMEKDEQAAANLLLNCK